MEGAVISSYFHITFLAKPCKRFIDEDIDKNGGVHEKDFYFCLLWSVFSISDMNVMAYNRLSTKLFRNTSKIL